MRSPASSARSSLLAMRGRDYPIGPPSKNSAESGIAVEDGDVAFLQAAGAAEAEVGGEDVAEHHLCAQLRAGAGVQLEVALARRPCVAHVGVERAVEPPQEEGKRPGPGLDRPDGEAILGGAERDFFAVESAVGVSAQEAQGRAGGVD